MVLCTYQGGRDGVLYLQGVYNSVLGVYGSVMYLSRWA